MYGRLTYEQPAGHSRLCECVNVRESVFRDRSCVYTHFDVPYVIVFLPFRIIHSLFFRIHLLVELMPCLVACYFLLFFSSSSSSIQFYFASSERIRRAYRSVSANDTNNSFPKRYSLLILSLQTTFNTYYYYVFICCSYIVMDTYSWCLLACAYTNNDDDVSNRKRAPYDKLLVDLNLVKLSIHTFTLSIEV